MGNNPSDNVFQNGHYPNMAKKIELDSDWPEWRTRLASLVNDSDMSMKEISLKANLGETFIRDAIKRGREPSVSKLRIVHQVLGRGSEHSSPGFYDPTDLYDKLSSWLRLTLKEKGISRTELSWMLSERLGRSIDVDTVNEMTEGKRAIAGDELVQIELITGATALNSSNELSPDEKTDTSEKISEEETTSFIQIPEFDVQASAGGGALIDRENVISNWPFAPDFIRDVLNLEARHLAMIEVRGDSMEPTLSSADKVMINMADKHVQQPGIFVLWDGNGTVVKRVEYMFGTETPKVLLISDNNRHNDYEVEIDQVQIVGRVVWAARRM